MLRGGRFKRSKLSFGRNPSNLCVVPIENSANNKSMQLSPNLTIPQQVFPTVIPVPILPSNSSHFLNSNVNYRGRPGRKRQRKRNRNRNKNVSEDHPYNWYSPILEDQKNDVAKSDKVKNDTANESKNAEVTPEVPPEEDFEEVEVASSEGEGKKIPVGFRKTKLQYLNYKKNSFFKPKHYYFSSQRTVINCLNVGDDDSVDVDVVSEAEYDEYEVGDHCDSTEKIDKIVEIQEGSSNENTDVEEDTTCIVTDEVGEDSAHIVTDEVDDESAHVVTDEVHEDSNDATEVDEDSTHAADEIGDKCAENITDLKEYFMNLLDDDSTHAVEHEVNKKSAFAVTDQVDEKSVCADDTNEVDENCTKINKVKNEISCDSNKTSISITRIYKTCIKDSSNDLLQEKCLIQDKLDAWESHLIGLEYLLEIRDKEKISVAKYFCVLCDKDLDFQELPEVCVINHVSGSNHITKYLEKHFQSCEFKYGENSTYDFVIQKFCEKINKHFGYYFMCITSSDYYTENNSKIKEIIQNASHPSEVDFEFEKSAFEKTVSSDLSENIGNMLKDIIDKVISENEIAATKLKKDIIDKVIPENEIAATKLKKDAKGNKNNKQVKCTQPNDEKKSFASKVQPKYKGNNSISTFLRLKFAAHSKLQTPAKETSNKSKPIQNKDQIVQNEKLIDEQQSAEVVKSDNDLVKNLKSKNEIENVKLKDKLVAPTVKTSDKKPENNAEMKNEHLEEKKLGDEAKKSKTAAAVGLDKTVSNLAKNVVTKQAFKNKEKVVVKTPLHKKYCPKRILDKGITRLRLAAAKTAAKSKLVTEVSDKSTVKCKSLTEKVNSGSPKEIIAKKIIQKEIKESKIAVTSIHKKKPLFKFISFQKPNVLESKPTVAGHTCSHQKSTHKKSTEGSSKDEVNTVTNDSSRWIPMRASSPVLTSDISLFLKKIACPPSENPVKRRKLSKSPIRKITSPLRLVTRNRSRIYSKSPRRKRDSKSPIRLRSRSPYRKSPKSPTRRSRSPTRRRSRSPLRRHSRSPLRLRSRSPRRRSRSPLRPRSRSPLRRNSRSPVRKRSRSPLRRRSRSPLRRNSRSPLRRRSRSPLRRHSRSPVKRRSRSPRRRNSRSPIKRRSRSPHRRHSRSPVKKFSDNSNSYRNSRHLDSPNIEQSSSSREYFSSNERYHRNAFNFPKHLDLRESDIARSRDASRMLHSSKMNKSVRYKSETSLPPLSARDLDPVSDEDESIYFNDKHLRPEDINPNSSKAMLSKLWQKMSMTDNSSDPALSNLVQFMETHKAEIEEFIALKSTSKSEKTNVVKIDSNLQQQALFLQQFLLANLAGNIQESRPPVPNMQFTPQPHFIPENIVHRYGHPSIAMPPPSNMPPVPPQPAAIQPRFFPPNVNVPPPHLFPPSNQPNPDFSPKHAPAPAPPPEIMFKDLKATVNKLFGAHEGVMKQNVKPQVSGFVAKPDSEKWDLNRPNAPKFNTSLSSKNVFPSPGKNVNFGGIRDNPIVREQTSSHNSKASEQFFGGTSNDRSPIPNLPVPPPNAKVTFCDSPRSSSKGNLFPVISPNSSASSARAGVNDVKVSLAQRLASVLVKIGMVDVPAPLLQEMLMKIGAFSSSPRQDISENEILSILKRLGYL